jgi:predicted nuclease with TOPRIM domain
MNKLKQNWLTYVLVIIIVVIGYVALFNTGTKDLKNKIKEIEKINDSLLRKNDFYKAERDSISLKLIERQKQIETIECMERELISKVSAIDKKINDIKPKYEKAKDIVRNYNSDSISRYFSDLK